MPKLPLLARLILSAMRSSSSLRGELRQTNRHLAAIATALHDTNNLERMKMGLPLVDGEGDHPVEHARAADSGLSPDPRFGSAGEFDRFVLSEDAREAFVGLYFREPTEAELLELVEAAQYGKDRGGVPASAPQRPPQAARDQHNPRDQRDPRDLSAPPPAEG